MRGSIAKISALIFVVLVLVSALATWLIFSPVTTGSKKELHVLKIRTGTSFNKLIQQMNEQKLLNHPFKFKLTAKLLGGQNRIKAGKYHIYGGVSSYRLLKMLVEGKVAMEWVTIPEGKTARQIASLLRKKLEIDSTRFMQLVFDSSYARKLGIPATSLEGFLYPDTYGFYWGMKSEEIIPVLVNEFKKQFNDTLKARAKQMGWSILEVVTLASIIEGEAMVDSERTLISAVYHNRLKKGMLLQADPTIQYIIPDGPRRLLNKDLEIDSPYNTYKYTGLPPGPINNPGIASIKAALYPARVNYLYFVARGDGSHVFSITLNEHLRAKAAFDRYRKEVERKKRARQNERKI